VSGNTLSAKVYLPEEQQNLQLVTLSSTESLSITHPMRPHLQQGSLPNAVAHKKLGQAQPLSRPRKHRALNRIMSVFPVLPALPVPIKPLYEKLDSTAS